MPGSRPRDSVEAGDPAPLERVHTRIVACRRCPRLVEHRQHIGRVKRRAFRDDDYWAKAVPSFGDPAAGLLIVGLAPAAHGANRTGRMFTGDRSGQWLYRALFRAGFSSQAESVARDDRLQLRDAYITAAAHCAPPDNKPTTEELATCRPFLVEELRHFTTHRGVRRKPLVVLALGQIAFKACLETISEIGVAVGSPRPKFGHACEYSLAEDIVLLGSYHPSQQNTQTGRLTEGMLDAVFARAGALLAGG